VAITPENTSPGRLPKLLADDVVVIVFAGIGFIGSVVLYLWTSAAPIIIAFFLATGIAAFVYKFLGGIQGASIAIGTLKLGGVMAALVGLALIINGKLETQPKFHPVSDDMMVGEWRWVYAKGGWEGELLFTKDDKGQLRFTGSESEWFNKDKDNDTREKRLLFDLKNGKAHVVGLNGVQFETDVHDYKYNRDFRLVGTAPLTRVGPSTEAEVQAWINAGTL
jgi:hypothetical protein